MYRESHACMLQKGCYSQNLSKGISANISTLEIYPLYGRLSFTKCMFIYRLWTPSQSLYSSIILCNTIQTTDCMRRGIFFLTSCLRHKNLFCCRTLQGQVFSHEYNVLVYDRFLSVCVVLMFTPLFLFVCASN